MKYIIPFQPCAQLMIYHTVQFNSAYPHKNICVFFFSGSIECGSKSIVSVSVECCSCLVGTGFSRAIKGSMARRSTNNSMSAMMAVSDEN